MAFTRSLASSLALLCSFAAGGNAFDHELYTTSPPVYPSPNITGIGGWDDALTKAKTFLAELTLEEKVQLVTGTAGPCVGNIGPIERLGFNGLCLQDGPAAIRQATFASVFPAQLAAAASWDRDLIYQRGLYMGQEYKDKGSQVALAPVCGPLGRSAYGGRNWEGFSPDPYLTGIAVAESVRGIQDAGVQATTKHYIGNEQETQRNPSLVKNVTVEAVSANIDDKTMHEAYLWPFADAVHAGTASIMCSYNRINGSYGCQNSKTLNGLLKTELGFQGYVMSDWGGTHAGVAAIEAGLDMNMPGGIAFTKPNPSYFGANLTTAVNNGSVPETRVDDMILRILTPYYFLNQDQDFPLIDKSSEPMNFFSPDDYLYNYTLGPIVDARANHKNLVRDLAGQATVLLKNTNSALPLKSPKNIAIFGNDAGDLSMGLYLTNFEDPQGYEYGTLAVGGGSGTGRFTEIVSPVEAFKARAKADGAIVQYTLNNTHVIVNGLEYVAPSPPDVCLVFIKSWAAEGYDRLSLLADYNGTAVVESVAAECNNTVVVLHGTGPIVVPFAGHENVTAILAAHFPGEETGNAVVDVLYGDVNPSGHLPYTVAHTEADYPRNLVNSTELWTTTEWNAWQADFEEGQLIDYKHFDSANKSVLYEFGFGLSYTTFELSDLVVNAPTANLSRTPSAEAQVIPGGNEELWDDVASVTVKVKNTGAVAGKAVPQLYLSFPEEAGADTPVRSLRGFEKVTLEPGQTCEVKFPLRRRDVSYWSVVKQEWVIPTEAIAVNVGFSSRDLKLNGELVA